VLKDFGNLVFFFLRHFDIRCMKYYPVDQTSVFLTLKLDGSCLVYCYCKLSVWHHVVFSNIKPKYFL